MTIKTITTMANKKFDDKKGYVRALNSVYNFHYRCFNTILAYLKEHGDRIITEEDNDPDPWEFCFLDMEGSYKVNAVRLTEDGEDFYLDTTSKSGDNYPIYWSGINHDMIVTEMLMGLVFND